MHDHVLVAANMAARIPMIRVGEVSTEYGALVPVDELANPVGTAEHAAVEVHAHHDDVAGLSFLEQGQQLVAVVGYGVRG
jgi:hypothetical protein